MALRAPVAARCHSRLAAGSRPLFDPLRALAAAGFAHPGAGGVAAGMSLLWPGGPRVGRYGRAPRTRRHRRRAHWQSRIRPAVAGGDGIGCSAVAVACARPRRGAVQRLASDRPVAGRNCACARHRRRVAACARCADLGRRCRQPRTQLAAADSDSGTGGAALSLARRVAACSDSARDHCRRAASAGAGRDGA